MTDPRLLGLGPATLPTPPDRSPVNQITATLIGSREILDRVNAIINEAIGDAPLDGGGSLAKAECYNGTLNAVARQAHDLSGYVSYTHCRLDALRNAISE